VFDLLQHPPHSPEPVRVGATVSIMTHALVVLSLALGTRQAAVQIEMAQESIIETAIRYLLPPDKRAAQSEETLSRYTTQRAGPLPSTTSAEEYASPEAKQAGADATKDMDGSTQMSLAEAASAQDAFTLIDVDTAVARDPESAAPKYPASLQARGIEGSAIVRFVVDTTGYADLESFRLMETNHPLFGASVREALPGMKFRPAAIGSRKVRQLVELPFAFRIIRPGSSPPDKKP
jgi:TonB family protein